MSSMERMLTRSSLIPYQREAASLNQVNKPQTMSMSLLPTSLSLIQSMELLRSALLEQMSSLKSTKLLELIRISPPKHSQLNPHLWNQRFRLPSRMWPKRLLQQSLLIALMTLTTYRLLSQLIPPTLPINLPTLEMKMKTMTRMKTMRLRCNNPLILVKRQRLLLKPMLPHSRYSRIG